MTRVRYESLLPILEDILDKNGGTREGQLRAVQGDCLEGVCQVRRAVPVPPARPTPRGAGSRFSLRAERQWELEGMSCTSQPHARSAASGGVGSWRPKGKALPKRPHMLIKPYTVR